MMTQDIRVAKCNGRGDDGDHCCYVNGKVCEFLFIDRGNTPRCSVWDKMNTGRWRDSPVGQMFAVQYPGFTCRDWPQNIPDIVGSLCCWDGEV